jgi:CRP-like cAMP-binding protein
MLLHIRVTLDELMTKHPAIAKRMMLLLAERLVKTTEDWREAVTPVEVR